MINNDTWLETANEALALINKQPISTLSSGTNDIVTSQINYHLTSALEDVASQYAWTSLTKLVKLNEASLSYTPPDYSKAYNLPSDMVRLISIAHDVACEVRGSQVFTDSDEVIVKYIKKPLNSSDLNPPVRAAVVYLLASKLALSLTGDSAAQQTNFSLYANKISAAIAQDQSFKPDQLPDDTYHGWWRSKTNDITSEDTDTI